MRRLLEEKTAVKKPLKLICKISTTIIEAEKDYGRDKITSSSATAPHARRSQLRAPSVALFDKIVLRLGKEYGF